MQENIKNKPVSLLKRAIPFFIVILVFMALMSLMGLLKKPPAVIPEKPIGFLVETQQLKPSQYTIQIHSQGIVTPKHQILLTSEISGKIISLGAAFTTGGHFKKGDVLVNIDPADYQVAVQQAKASLASAQANRDLEQARSEQALKDWQSFGKKGQPSNLVLNIPQLQGAQANVKAAQAALAKAQRDLSKTTVTAPFDGVVINKSVDIGQYVGVVSSLGTIAGSAVAEVRLPLTQKDIDKLNLGHGNIDHKSLPVTLSDQQQTLKGNLVRVEAAKDSNTLLYHTVAEINDPLDKGLFFNAFVEADIEGDTLTDVFAVPAAWMMANDKIAVYREGKLAILEVQVAHKTDDYDYVTSGLSAQDQIIITPIQAPENGMTLRLKTMESGSKEPAASEQEAL